MESSLYANEDTKNKTWKVARLLPQTSHHFSEAEEQAVFLAIVSPPPSGLQKKFFLTASFCSQFKKHGKQTNFFSL